MEVCKNNIIGSKEVVDIGGESRKTPQCTTLGGKQSGEEKTRFNWKWNGWGKNNRGNY